MSDQPLKDSLLLSLRRKHTRHLGNRLAFSRLQSERLELNQSVTRQGRQFLQALKESARINIEPNSTPVCRCEGGAGSKSARARRRDSADFAQQQNADLTVKFDQKITGLKAELQQVWVTVQNLLRLKGWAKRLKVEDPEKNLLLRCLEDLEDARESKTAMAKLLASASQLKTSMQKSFELQRSAEVSSVVKRFQAKKEELETQLLALKQKIADLEAEQSVSHRVVEEKTSIEKQLRKEVRKLLLEREVAVMELASCRRSPEPRLRLSGRFAKEQGETRLQLSNTPMKLIHT